MTALDVLQGLSDSSDICVIQAVAVDRSPSIYSAIKTIPAAAAIITAHFNLLCSHSLEKVCGTIQYMTRRDAGAGTVDPKTCVCFVCRNGERQGDWMEKIIEK